MADKPKGRIPMATHGGDDAKERFPRRTEANNESGEGSAKRARPVMRPNISKAATMTCASRNKDSKDAQKDKKNQGAGSSRGRGRGRGRGGGGRGGRREPNKTVYTAEELDEMARQAGTVELLPSAALFDGSKKERRERLEELDRAKNEKVVGYIDEEKKAIKKLPKDPNEFSLLAYEDEWHSDREADEEALEALRKEASSIIDDIGEGEIVPKVLPHRDMPTVRAACDYDPKTSYIEPKIDQDGNVVPTPVRSAKYLMKQGGEEMRKLLEEDYEQPMLFQFPAGTIDLQKLWESSKKKRADDVEPMDTTPADMNGDEYDADEVTIFDDEYVHGLTDLPHGTRIGKLQFTKSGRCYLKVRGSSEKLTIAHSVYENKIKNVMALIPERNPNDKEPMEVLGVQEGDKVENADIVGIAEKFFVCSFDTTKICGKNRRIQAVKRDAEPFRSIRRHRVSHKCYQEWLTGVPATFDEEEEEFVDEAKKCLEQEIQAQKRAAAQIERRDALLGKLLKKRRGNTLREMVAKASR